MVRLLYEADLGNEVRLGYAAFNSPHPSSPVTLEVSYCVVGAENTNGASARSRRDAANLSMVEAMVQERNILNAGCRISGNPSCPRPFI